MDVFKLRDESLILVAESVNEQDFSDNEENAMPKKYSSENDSHASPHTEEPSQIMKSQKNIPDNESSSTNNGLHSNSRESKSESLISKHQELILNNLNGEAKFEKLILDQTKVPEKIR